MYIDPRHKVFGYLDRLAGWGAGERPGPATVEWDLSNRCVLGCQDCHFAHTHVRGPWAVQDRRLPMAFESTGDLADWNLVLRVLGELPKVGVRGVVWSGGGEPTTHPDWTQITEYAADAGLEQGMYTCGGLLTRQTAARLAQLATWVVVSLDAADGDTYAAEKGVPASRFEAACQGIRWLAGSKAAIGVSFLLHEGNWTQIHDMHALAKRLGATYALFRPAIRTAPDTPGIPLDDRGWIVDALPLLRVLSARSDVEVDVQRFLDYRQWTGHGYATCTGIRLNTTITPDGRMWICPQRRGVTALGDLRQESFAAVWARHPGIYTVDAGCRAMCRLHPVNQALTAIAAPRTHAAFA